MARRTFLFKIDPVAKGRPRISKRGWAYTPDKTRRYEQEIAIMAKQQFNEEPFTGALSATIRFFFARPKTVKRLSHTVKPDLDNLVKAVLDPLNGIIFKDDSQITGLHAYKAYSNYESYIILEIHNHDED